MQRVSRMSAAPSCPDANVAALFVARGLMPEEAIAFEAHIDACADCRELLSQLASDEAGEIACAATVRSHSPPLSGATALPEVGARIGRYVVDAPLGAGGMGVVLRAYDPELGRWVALKMVRGEFAGRPELEAMLRREARAMACLSHPNVVRVYDIVLHASRIFVAMELIDGVSMKEWLAAEKRPWRDVVNAFVHAGRGLAAAHAVGLVHRDFKPQNVLVDNSDRRVSVTDFGLARLVAASEELVPCSAASLVATRAGSVLGTPGYMSPEQHRGEPADARSDQFAFCASLYEGLYDQPAFAGDSLEELARSVNAGAVRSPPSGTRVPTFVHRTLLQGLATDPGKRFPSMEALLAELRKDPHRRLRRSLFAGAAVSLAAIAVVTAWHTGARATKAPARYPTAEQKLAGVWDADRKAAVERALLATGKAYAAASFQGTQRELNAYAGAWSKMYLETRSAVESGNVHGFGTMACLEDDRAELRALVDLLTHADAELVAQAVPAAQSLSSVARCADRAEIALRAPDPVDPKARADRERIREGLARVEVMCTVGKWQEAIPVAAQIVESTRATRDRTLVARALIAQGCVLSHSGSDLAASERVLREAATEADAAGDDRTRAQAFTYLIHQLGYTQGRWAELPPLRDQAWAAIHRLGGEDEIEAGLTNELAYPLYMRGQREGLVMMRRVCDLIASAKGPTSTDYGICRSNLALALSELGEPAEALPLVENAVEVLEHAVGPDNPLVGVAHYNRADALFAMLRFEEAEASYRRALRLLEIGGTPEVPLALAAIGRTLTELGRTEEAITTLRRSVDLSDKIDGHPFSQPALVALGAAHLAAGDARHALPPLERALQTDIKEARLRAEAALLLGESLLADRGDRTRARHLLESARDAYRELSPTPRRDRDLDRCERLIARFTKSRGGSP